MTQNVGKLDRLARIVIGIGLLSMLMLVDSGWKWLGLIGLVPLFTALAGWCPAYSAFGVKTCPTSSKH